MGMDLSRTRYLSRSRQTCNNFLLVLYSYDFGKGLLITVSTLQRILVVVLLNILLLYLKGVKQLLFLYFGERNGQRRTIHRNCRISEEDSINTAREVESEGAWCNYIRAEGEDPENLNSRDKEEEPEMLNSKEEEQESENLNSRSDFEVTRGKYQPQLWFEGEVEDFVPGEDTLLICEGDGEEIVMSARTFTMYKTVNKKVKPVSETFPQEALVVRKFPHDPLEGLHNLPTRFRRSV